MPSPFIMTRSGQRFAHGQPDWRTIRITDIAHSLAHQCRFLGHTDRFWSTAQHSIEVSLLCSAWAPEGQKHEAGLAGLLHDAHEAYIGDFPTPFKTLLAETYNVDFAVFEAGVIQALTKALGVTAIMEKHADAVHRADRAALYSDAIRWGMDEHRVWVPEDAPVYFANTAAMAPEEAKQAFLTRFAALDGFNVIPANPADDPGTPYAMREPADLRKAA